MIRVQARRLADGQEAARAASEAAMASHRYRHDNLVPFWIMEADRHFLLIAARNLVGALSRWGEDYPDERVDVAVIRILRDWHEHPADAKSAARRFAALDPEPGVTPETHVWRGDETILGGRLSVKALREWAAHVHDELRRVDCWQISEPFTGPMRAAVDSA